MTFGWEREEVLSKIPGYDPSYAIEYFNNWSTYEENGYLFILSKDDVFYILEHQYSVMSDDNSEYWNPEIVSMEDAIREMGEYDQSCAVIDKYMA